VKIETGGGGVSKESRKEESREKTFRIKGGTLKNTSSIGKRSKGRKCLLQAAWGSKKERNPRRPRLAKGKEVLKENVQKKETARWVFFNKKEEGWVRGKRKKEGARGRKNASGQTLVDKPPWAYPSLGR